MDEARRRSYLHALGVTVWELRAAVRPESLSPSSASEPLTHETPISGLPLPPAGGEGRGEGVERSRAIPELASPAQPTRDWPELEIAVRQCSACGLHTTRTNTVFGVGNRKATWMFVGEAPGAEEDAQGEPFVGRAGQLLNAMIFALGLRREDVFIANVLKCRPPGNRDPQPAEVEQCEPFLIEQIALIQPRILVALGRHAAHSLLKTELPLARLRGQAHRYQEIPLVVTYHPAYLLRTPSDKRRAWEDLQRAQGIVQGAM